MGNAQLEPTAHLLQQLTLQSQYFISESPNLTTFLCDRHNTCSHRVDIYILTATRIHLGTRRVGDGDLVHRIHQFSHLRSLSPSWVELTCHTPHHPDGRHGRHRPSPSAQLYHCDLESIFPLSPVIPTRTHSIIPRVVCSLYSSIQYLVSAMSYIQITYLHLSPA
jgi:hypothetical protein